ncbi:MAG: hypothetical protein JW682_01910, partial [Campylobacterales bacterium]|nr:hypothetical protein [Campylobacterales bacterium]
YANTATIAGNENDPTPGDDTSTKSVTPTALPVANDDSSTGSSTGTPVTVNILVNDTDNDGDINASTVNITTPGAEDSDGDGDNDTLVVAGEGTWKADNTTGAVIFTPEAGFTGDPTPISYTVKDKTGQTSNEAIVMVDYIPMITVNSETENEGETFVFDVNLSNPGTEAITFIPELIDGNATVAVDLNVTEVIYSVDGGTTWTPYVGGEITIPAGITSVMISIPSINDTIHEGDETFTVSVTVTSGNTENPAAKGTGTILDSDPLPSVTIADETVTEGEILNFTVVLSNPSHEDINLTIETSDGTATEEDNDYTPVSTTVLIPAGETSVMVSMPTTDDGIVEEDENITITPVRVNSGKVDQMSGAAGWILNDDHGPTATDDTVNGKTGENSVIRVIENDSSGTLPLDPATVRIIDPETGDKVTELDVPGEGRWVVDPVTGDIAFEPEEGFRGDPTPIEYSVEDASGNENQAMITVDYPPVAQDDNATGKMNEIITVNVLENDSNTSKPLDPLSVIIVDAGAINGGKELFVEDEGTWRVEDNGAITFTPVESFSGYTTPIHYTVSEEDPTGEVDTSNIAEVVIHYPAAVDDLKNTSDAPGTPQSIPVLENDSLCTNVLDLNVQYASDPDLCSDLVSVVIIDPETNATTDTLTVPGEGVWIVKSNGEISFTPDKGFVSDPTPIEYQVEYGGSKTTNRAAVTINYPLLARDDQSLDNDYGAVVTLDVLDNDNGDINTSSVTLHLPDGFLDEYPDAQMSDDNKSLIVLGQGEWIVNSDGTVMFVPEVGFEDDPAPIEYSVKDYSGTRSSVAILSVTYCDSPQRSDSGDAMSNIGMLLMALLTGLTGLYFIRREEESRGY